MESIDLKATSANGKETTHRGNYIIALVRDDSIVYRRKALIEHPLTFIQVGSQFGVEVLPLLIHDVDCLIAKSDNALGLLLGKTGAFEYCDA